MKDIKEAVEAMLSRFESEKTFDRKEKYTIPEHIELLEKSDVFVALKAYLKPSKSEVADYLHACEFDGNHETTPEIHTAMLNHAISYLREESC